MEWVVCDYPHCTDEQIEAQSLDDLLRVTHLLNNVAGTGIQIWAMEKLVLFIVESFKSGLMVKCITKDQKENYKSSLPGDSVSL